MKIKQLEWKERFTESWTAKSQEIKFVIEKDKNGFALFSWTGNNDFPHFSTLEEAKQAAQSALEAYVRGFCEEKAAPPVDALIRENFELKRQFRESQGYV